MKAIRPAEPGGPEVLTLQEHPDPVLGPEQVLVATTAIGVNYIDIYHRRGLCPLPLPFTPASEAPGVVPNNGAYSARSVSDGSIDAAR